MAKRKDPSIHGWLNIHKPLGMSSTDVVRVVRRALRMRKVGHAGTLDPMAEGVLPIALGEATKTIYFMQDRTKTYSATLCFGQATNTDDAEGTIIEESKTIPSQEALLAALPQFTGNISQIPPAFSAIKINGKRAYAIARNGKVPELSARNVQVDSLEIIEWEDTAHLSLRVTCGKGTYIRALARDIGHALGSCAHLTALSREAVGHFLRSDAILLENWVEMVHTARPSGHVPGLLPVEAALDDIPVLPLTDAERQRLMQGQTIPYSGECLPFGTVVSTMFQKTLIALADYRNGELKPLRVFNLLNKGENDVDYRRA